MLKGGGLYIENCKLTEIKANKFLQNRVNFEKSIPLY